MNRLCRNPSTRGIALTELAIVLGVIGLIAAAIWATASVVHQRQRVEESVNVVTEIVDRVRGVYTGFRNPVAAPPGTTAAQIAAKFFPDSVINPAGNNTINAWGGEILMDFMSPLYGFSLAMVMPNTLPASVRNAACIDMMTRLPATGKRRVGGPPGPALTFPDPPPVTESSIQFKGQGRDPTFGFVAVGGSWTEVTGLSAGTMMSYLDGAGCEGVAYFFAF